MLKFESAEYGGHLDTTEIEQIPINNRRWSSLALTTPGVTNSSDGFGLLSFRAISPLLNVVEIDGADDNQAFFAEERGRTRAGYSTSQAAVREFKVNTGVYGADFGRAVGGVVNTVTKSGGNQHPRRSLLLQPQLEPLGACAVRYEHGLQPDHATRT